MADQGDHIIVGEWADLRRAPPPVSEKDRLRVATIFNEQSWRTVVWIPTWLLEDKDDLETTEMSDHLVVGELEDYSEDAWQLFQPHRNEGLLEPNEYLPKSQVVVFERSRTLDGEIDTPQRGLAEFGSGC